MSCWAWLDQTLRRLGSQRVGEGVIVHGVFLSWYVPLAPPPERLRRPEPSAPPPRPAAPRRVLVAA